MKTNKLSALHSSDRMDWETPQDFFDELDREFGFALDACATPETAKCEWYFTPDDDALKQRWVGVVYCNPPYGRAIGEWIKKAREESLRGATVVCLIPARTDTKYWHKYIWNERLHGPRAGVQVRLVKGRLKFVGADSSAPFPSAVIVFDNAL